MRQWIEYAVENYRSKNSFGFQLIKDLKERQIHQAIEKYARVVKPEEVVALMDTTVFKSGKTGFLFTDRYLYSDRYKEDGPVELMFLESVSVRPENNSCCVLTYEDGRTREVDISVFLDVVDVLDMVIEQRKEYEREEQEKEISQDAEPDKAKEPETGLKASGEAELPEKAGAAETDRTDGAAETKAAENVRTADRADRIEPAEPTAAGASGTVRTEDGRGEAEMAAAGVSPAPEEGRQGAKAAEAVRTAEESGPENSMELESMETEEPVLPMEIIRLEDLEEIDASEEESETEDMRWAMERIQPEGAGDPKEGVRADEPDETYEEALGLAEAGDKAAMYRLAMMYNTGKQTEKNLKKALYWFRKSAAAEYVPAMLQMMRFYRDGELVKQNFQLSMSWVKKAAATGEPEGQYALADAYIYGLGGKQDADAGLAILGEMAALGDESAQKMMTEVRRKMKDAKERFDAGIRNPSTASGYYEMGMYCRKGDGYYTYPKEAVQYFQTAAKKEHVDAQYQLARAYHYGDGVKKNEEQSVQWLEKAAAKSHKEAMELLEGIREKQRIKREKADFKSCLKQAEKGDAYSQSRVAELYLEGIGVKQDVWKGIEWYERASETDEGYAARQLAKIYAEGRLIPADEERAAYWRMVGGVLDEL